MKTLLSSILFVAVSMPTFAQALCLNEANLAAQPTATRIDQSCHFFEAALVDGGVSQYVVTYSCVPTVGSRLLRIQVDFQNPMFCEGPALSVLTKLPFE